MAGFRNEQCTNGGVEPTESLLFTCKLNGVVLLRVLLPNGYQELASIGDNAHAFTLPRGFTTMSLNITEIDESTRNISVSIFIESASLLNGGEIRCDDTSLSMASARCLMGKLSMYTVV